MNRDPIINHYNNVELVYYRRIDRPGASALERLCNIGHEADPAIITDDGLPRRVMAESDLYLYATSSNSQMS